MKETNHETQFKIHFQPFPSIAHNVSQFFCAIRYMKQAFVQFNDVLYSLYLVQYKYDKLCFKNLSPFEIMHRKILVCLLRYTINIYNVLHIMHRKFFVYACMQENV